MEKRDTTSPIVLTVAELTGKIKDNLESSFPDVWVSGELSNVRLYSSGHLYFSLADNDAILKAVVFRSRRERLPFKAEDGLAVLAHGRLSVYPPRGDYQLIVDELQLQGLGALMAAFEELKSRLAAEGLFATERKRPLPRLPRRVGIITSRDGAALRDILNVLERRHAGLDILLRHSTVQGPTAGEELAGAIETLGNSGLVDVIIIGRGGGSYEDLFCFNHEGLARAISACPVPVISAVGHEVDFTICDLVADVRAPTPSAAAELVTAERRELSLRVERARQSLRRVLRDYLAAGGQRLDGLTRLLAPGRLLEHLDTRRQRIDLTLERLHSLCAAGINGLRRRLQRPLGVLGGLRGASRLRQIQLDRRRRRLEAAAGDELSRKKQRLAGLLGGLGALDPEAVIGRGYGHLSLGEGPLSSAAGAKPGDSLHVELHDGVLETLVRRKLEREDESGKPQLRGGPGAARGDRRRAGKGRVSTDQTDLPL